MAAHIRDELIQTDVSLLTEPELTNLIRKINLNMKERETLRTTYKIRIAGIMGKICELADMSARGVNVNSALMLHQSEIRGMIHDFETLGTIETDIIFMRDYLHTIKVRNLKKSLRNKNKI